MREVLGALAAKTPASLIASIIGLADRRSDGDDDVVVPLVALHLRSGRTIQGWLLQLDVRSPNERALLVHTADGDPAQPKPDVTYLDVSAVEAMTIVGADQVAPWLPGGNQRPVRTEQPPGRLVLLRRAQEIVQSLSQLGWVGDADVQDLTGADPEAAFRLLQLVRNAHAVLQELLSDATAKDVFCASVKKISFAAGSGSVALVDATLTFTASAEPSSWMGKIALRAAISAVL